MGLLKTIAKNRRQRKAEIKAAQARAKQEVKSAAKLELHRAKLLANQEHKLLKQEKKELKAQRKHAKKMASAELARLKERRFNAKQVMRYSAAIRALAPLLLPLIYKLVVSIRENANKKNVQQLGIVATETEHQSARVTELKNRISTMEKSLSEYGIPAGFKRDAQDRLKQLSTALTNAQRMSPDQQERAYKTISADLDELNKEILVKSL